MLMEEQDKKCRTQIKQKIKQEEQNKKENKC